MQLELKRTIVVLVYWGILSLLTGWIAHQSEPIEILGLSVLYTLGFFASFESLSAEFRESVEDA